jgi:hypothetical protein
MKNNLKYWFLVFLLLLFIFSVLIWSMGYFGSPSDNLGSKNIQHFGLGVDNDKTSKTFNITVERKNEKHNFFGQGSDFGYVVDGDQVQKISLKVGKTYKFKVNTKGHPFYFSTENVGNNCPEGAMDILNTPLVEGSFSFTPKESTPQPLYSACCLHPWMGFQIEIFKV